MLFEMHKMQFLYWLKLELMAFERHNRRALLLQKDGDVGFCKSTSNWCSRY